MQLRPLVLEWQGNWELEVSQFWEDVQGACAFTPDVGGEEGADRPQICVPSVLTKLQQDPVGSPGRIRAFVFESLLYCTGVQGSKSMAA